MSEVSPSVSNRIKQEIKNRISALSSVQQVYGYEEPTPKGFPAVFVTPANMDGEFASNSENSRLYEFSVLIIFYVGQDAVPASTAPRQEYAEQVIATVIDEIINAMDTNFELPNSDSTVLYVNAADCSWGKYNLEAGVARAAQITLRVYTERTVQ